MIEPTPALEVEGVSVRYREVVALHDASLSLARGRVCALLGVNGSGKSSLFGAVMGTVRPAAGTVRILGGDPATARREGAVAYVPQSEQVDWTFPLRVRDVVMTGRYGRMGTTRRARPADRAAVEEALGLVELTALADRQIGRLSGGQRKRAFLARALAQDATLLLLDEPFAGVDKPSEATITALLRRAAGQGRSVLVSTHDLAALPQLCDDAVLVHQRVLASGPAHQVLRPEVLALAFGALPVPSAPSAQSASAVPGQVVLPAGPPLQREGAA